MRAIGKLKSTRPAVPSAHRCVQPQMQSCTIYSAKIRNVMFVRARGAAGQARAHPAGTSPFIYSHRTCLFPICGMFQGRKLQLPELAWQKRHIRCLPITKAS